MTKHNLYHGWLDGILEAVRVGGWYDANPDARQPDYMDVDVAKQAILTELKKAEKRGELKTALIFLRQAKTFNKLPIPEDVAPIVPEYFVKQIEVRVKKLKSELLEMEGE